MQTVSKSVLKAKMLGLFREIEKSGEELIVTDSNRPVLKIIPLKNQKASELFKKYQGKIKYKSPLEESTSDEWNEK